MLVFKLIWFELIMNMNSELFATTQPTKVAKLVTNLITSEPAEVAKLVEALEGLLAIIDESLGVSGYHLNGNMAKWCEFEEVEMAEEALAIYRQQRGEL